MGKKIRIRKNKDINGSVNKQEGENAMRNNTSKKLNSKRTVLKDQTNFNVTDCVGKNKDINVSVNKQEGDNAMRNNISKKLNSKRAVLKDQTNFNVTNCVGKNKPSLICGSKENKGISNKHHKNIKEMGNNTGGIKSGSAESGEKVTETGILKDKTNFIQTSQPRDLSSPNPCRYGLRKVQAIDYRQMVKGNLERNSFEETQSPKQITVDQISVAVNLRKDDISKKLDLQKNLKPSDCGNKEILRPLDDMNDHASDDLKQHKPIYTVNDCSPLKRKPLLSEEKLDIYEFEVDENEPKQKLKKKKPQRKLTTKRGKIVSKKILTSQINKLNQLNKKDEVILKPKENKKMVSPKMNSDNNKLSAKKNNQKLPSIESKLAGNHMIEVPVLFHNHQDASPSKSKHSSNHGNDGGYTAMSDDEINHSYDSPVRSSNTSFSNDKESIDKENKGKSQENNEILNKYFSPIRPSTANNLSKSRSSFTHEVSYECNINASTPVKYNIYSNTNNSTIDNYFGFDEPELIDEPLVSPIKAHEEVNSSNHSTNTQTSLNYDCKKNLSHNKTFSSPERKEEIPVQEVIKMLKFGVDDEKGESKIVRRDSSSSSSKSPPIFDDLPEPEVTFKKSHRRSYERPAYLRKINKSFQEESSDNEDHKENEKHHTHQKKKHQGHSKKEQDEMKKWIQAFNSQCQEVEKFDLLVE